MPHRQMPRRLLAVAVVLATALCAGATDAASPVVLKVGDQKGGSQALMSAAGELADLPYRLEWSEFAAAAPLLEALNAGAIDTGYVGDAPFTFAAAAGVPARIIAAVRQKQEGLAIVVPANSPIRIFDDLKGRRIGTGKGSIGHYLVIAAFDRAGVDLQTVNLVYLTPADAKAALSGGAIDAWSTWEPYTAMLEIEGGRRIVDGQGITNGLSYQVASPGAIADKRAVLEDYVRRHARARLWVLDHADEYATAWATLMNLPAAAAKLWFERAQIRPVAIDDGVIAGQQHVVDLYAKAGVIKTSFPVEAAFDRSFNAAVALAVQQP
jgi:sulfonate transport system substrate-binding protein